MAQDMPNGHLNGGGGHKALRNVDFRKTLIWDSMDDLDQFAALVANPPNHSVVVHIDPVVAKGILKVANDKNRPINKGSVYNLVNAHEEGIFALTGDTLKVSRKGRLLDGQYRLTACVEANKGFETHIVFGLDEKVFDILDRQRTRTPGDILSICNVKSPIITAGAVRWVMHMTEGRKGRTNRGITPRHIRELATGSMKDISHYGGIAEQLRSAYKIPPTQTAALLFLIGQGGGRPLAENFAQDWLHGNRNYTRNKAFDVLAQKVVSVKAQNNGHLNRTVMAAMMVLTFNYWNANVLPTTKGLSWAKQFAFPKLAFDKDAFIRERERRKATDESLPALQERMLKAIYDLRDTDGNVERKVSDIARQAGVDDRHVNYVLGTLRDAGLVHQSRKAQVGKQNVPAIWRLKDAGEAKIATLVA